MAHVEITLEAFNALVGNAEPSEVTEQGGATVELYQTKGVSLKAITNYYSTAVTQYYIQDINA